jgi:hypothetical protein
MGQRVHHSAARLTRYYRGHYKEVKAGPRQAAGSEGKQLWLPEATQVGYWR